MTNSDAFVVLISVIGGGWLILQAIRLLWRKTKQTGHRLVRRITVHSFDFRKLDEIPLSDPERERFCALAVALGVSQRTLLAEAIKAYMDMHRTSTRTRSRRG